MCGEQSKLLVEQHMAQCPSCKNNYLAMTADVSEPSSTTLEGGHDHPSELTEQQQLLDTSAVKVLKRIRKKWLLTTLSTLLLVPLLWLGFNQYRGIGLSYTNMYDYYAVGRFISAIEDGDYDKAFTYIDTATYYSLTKSSLQDIFSALPPTKDDFQLVTSENGDQYYTDGDIQIAASEFEQWLENAVENQKILQAANEDSPYNDMRYEEFVEVSKQNFIEHLQKWQKLGYTLEGRGVVDSYKDDGTRHTYDYKLAIYNKHNEVEYGTISLGGSGSGKFVHSSSSYTPDETFISLFTSNITIWE